MLRRVLFVALLFGSMALAQDTSSCAPLLELGLSQAQRPVSEPIETLAYTVESTQTVEGHELALAVTSVFDFRNERVYQSISYEDEPTMILRYSDGRATMEIPGSDMETSAPPQLVTQLEELLRTILEGLSDPTRIVGEAEIISCDGPVAYGDVLAGEQVTIRTSGGPMITESLRVDAPLRVVYADRALAGMVQDVPDFGETLLVLDEVRVDAEGSLERFVWHQYRWNGSTAEPVGSTSVAFEIDAPVDASLFGP